MTDTAVPGQVHGRPLVGALVGRSAELAALEELLDHDDVRLVALTGPVGVGKSRLAAEVAHRRAARGELVVDVALGDISDRGLAADAVLAALSTDPTTDATTPAQALWRRGQGAPALLVLDDGDGVLGLGELVLDLVDSYPALTVLATSVRPLRVRGERIVALKPFGTPDSGDDAAVELFAARAAAADASFVLDDSTRAAVAEVCRAVGGLPLAIELAAARVAAVPPSVMAAQLSRSLDLLHQDPVVGVPDRHRSVDAALDWSYGLLCDAARSVLVQLSVFEGAFPLEAAVAVVAPRQAEPEMLDHLSELVDAHLIDLETPATDTALFRLDPLMRRRARRRLQDSGDEPRVRDAHADYWAARCRIDPTTASRSWPDVLAALDRRVSTGEHDEALHIAVMAAPDLATSPGAQASLLPLVETVLGDGTVSDDALLARTLMWATVHSPAEEQSTAAYGAWTSRRLRRSIELARSSGDDAALLEALELTVRTLSVTFDLEGAVASAHEGHALASRLGDEAALARFDVWVAMAQRVVGDMAGFARSARSAYERGLRVGEDIAVVHGALMLHGLPVEEQGPEPLLDLDELLRRAERVRQPVLELHVLGVMAARDLALGDSEGATRRIGRMLLIADGVQSTWPMASVAPLMLLLPISLGRGAVDDAVVLCEAISPIESLLPSIAPSMAPAYAAAAAAVRASVPPERYAAVADDVRGITFSEANRRAQLMVRSYLPPRTPGVPAQASTVTATAPLTPRERDVLAQLVSGGTNREIGEALGMSPKTVMHHTVAIYRKLGVRGRAEAVAWALRSR
ncbi:MAG: LuxR C-terminal-related transcriptional regulator [Candidatus Nanopelagicales bacterium]